MIIKITYSRTYANRLASAELKLYNPFDKKYFENCFK